MIQAFGTNSMQRGLIKEASLKKAAEKVIAEGWAVKDHKGDKWILRHDLIRNETHPHHWKMTADEKKKHGDTPNRISAWHNQRTNEIHEGGITISANPGGHATIGSGSDYSSRFFHLNHYDIKPIEKKEQGA